MKVTRKDFIKSSSILLGGLFLGGSRLLDALQENTTGFRNINENIGIYTERGGTILWYVANDGIAIVDAQFPDTAKNMHEGLKKKSGKKIDFLFNTHHHGDHTSGNFYLKDYADKIVANENCARLQKLKNGQGENDKKQAYPNLTFQDNSLYGLGKERIEAYHFFPAHTGGDSIYHFVNSNVVHMGDLVFNGLTPYFGLSDEGSFKGWIKFLEKAVDKFQKDTKFVFGHSANPEKLIGTKEDLVRMKDYISTLLDYVAKGKAAGKTKEEIAGAIDITKFNGVKEMRQGALKGNAEQAFNELSRG
jgi:glyoxylase-like metal-dependent hydrolase (beta-lactamase superfamily II)